MKTISIRDFKIILSGLSQDEVVSDIVTLYKDIPAVREYYIAKLYPEEEAALFEKYKKIVEDEFFPDKGFGKIRAAIVRKAISDFKKIAQSPKYVVELLFTHVSIGVDFTNNYGDIDEKFYRSLETSFGQALEYACKNDIREMVKSDAEMLRQKCQGFGWGFSDTINDIFLNYYGNEDEENQVVG